MKSAGVRLAERLGLGLGARCFAKADEFGLYSIGSRVYGLGFRVGRYEQNRPSNEL